MAEPKRIAQVLGTVSTGGVASCVFNFYKNIDHSRYQFDFYTYDDSPYDEEILAMGGRIFHYPKVFNVPKCVSFLSKQFKENGYEIVHVHLTTLSFVPLMAAKKAGVPFRLCHAHSTTHREEGFKYYVKTALRSISSKNATHLLGCSNLSVNWLYRKKADEAFLLHNAVDLDRFSLSEEERKAAAEKYGKADNKIVGFVGRFEIQKNVPFLVEAFALLAKKRSNVRLALVGDGSEREIVERIIEENGLNNLVTVYPEQRNVEEYYALFDLFVLPSRYEGLPLVAIEAQTAGLPTILSQYITHEVDVTSTCVFMSIDGENAKENWANKMAELLDSPLKDNVALVKKAGYDIVEEAARLADYYDGLKWKRT